MKIVYSTNKLNTFIMNVAIYKYIDNKLKKATYNNIDSILLNNKINTVFNQNNNQQCQHTKNKLQIIV